MSAAFRINSRAPCPAFLHSWGHTSASQVRLTLHQGHLPSESSAIFFGSSNRRNTPPYILVLVTLQLPFSSRCISSNKASSGRLKQLCSNVFILKPSIFWRSFGNYF